MSEDDKAFYHRRAEEELVHAQRATDESLVSYHYRLAGFYLDLIYGSPTAYPNDQGQVAH